MRLGNGFVSDRVVQARVNGTYRKYTYHPTPDHRFLLEIGLAHRHFQVRSRMDLAPDIEEFAARTPSLVNVKAYNVFSTP